MTHDDNTLQAAIDAALQTNGDEHAGSLVTSKSSVYWPSESLARLAVAKAFLAALPPASSENWQARAEKAEAALANAKATIEALKKAEADSVARPCLSRLRPLAEAGPVPEGAVRFIGYLDADGNWDIGNYTCSKDTHFADIRLPAEPALASEASQGAETFEAHGMSLRDWFAGQALRALISEDPANTHALDNSNGRTLDDWLSMNAYGFADAMLAARKKKQC